MVDALSEARRVLAPSGVLIDVRPVNAPIVVEVVIGGETVWGRTVESYSAPLDVAAAGAAVEEALSRDWFAFTASARFQFEIYCDNAADLREYVEGRKLYGAEIPYIECEERRRNASADQPARLRCLRPWMLGTYRKT